MADRVFVLPDLGEGLEDATIVAWLVAEGDTVSLNQPLVEVETAKATVEIPSPFAGVVQSLHAVEGSAVGVGSALVTFSGVAGVGGGGGSAGQSPPNPRSATAAPQSPSGVAPSASAGGTRETGVAATPPVRRLAKELGVDLSAVLGTGPGGRVTAEDVRVAASSHGENVARTDDERVAVTPVRRAIAERLSRVAAIPQVTTFRTVDCAALEEFRERLGVSPLPVLVGALCRVIEGHPRLNSTWMDQEILVHGTIDAGVAVDTERGLVVPVVRDTARWGIDDLAAEIRRLAGAARDNRLTLEDVAHPTIAISNTGSYGSEAGTPLLTPGCAVTIAIGVIAPRALVVDGGVVARPACTLSLTFDHRVLDGADAGRALTDLVDLLQRRDRLGDLPR